jgi:hypothetical protein
VILVKKISYVIGIGIILAITWFSVAQNFDRNVTAQKSATINWDYAAVTGAYVPYTTDNPSSNVVAAVTICYMKADGCQNEEIKGEVNYSKFLQDARLENTQVARRFAQNKAAETAFAKAFARLGLNGYELVSAPGLQFDQYVLNSSGTFTVQEGNNERPADIYFKRQK